eukprot:4705552-Prymnesium_polylepis.1
MSAGASRIRSRRNHRCRLSSFAFAGREHLAPCHAVSNDARSIDRFTTSKTVISGTRSSALIS